MTRAIDGDKRLRPPVVGNHTAVALLAVVLMSGCEGSTKHAQPTSQPKQAQAVSRNAEKGPVKLRVELDRSEVTAPQSLTLTITVDAEKGVDAPLPEMKDFLGDCVIRDARDLPPTETDLTRAQSRVLTLESVLPGEQSIPEVTVKFTDRREKADGSSDPYEDEVTTAAIPIRVHQGLADVKGPVALPWPRAYAWMAWTLAAIAAVVLAAGLLRRWLLRRGGAERLARPVFVPAHIWALAELDILVSESLIERGKVQEFYYRINAIVRGYIERRFGLMAGEQTSEEFVRSTQRSSFLAPPHKEVLQRFVAACDPVKYARQIPDPGEIEWVQATARDFVLETAERPAPDARTEPVLEQGVAA